MKRVRPTPQRSTTEEPEVAAFGIVKTSGTVDQLLAAAKGPAPLWGVRMRPRLMHDGRSLMFSAAILRHGGEAAPERRKFQELKPSEKQQLIACLKSL